MPVLLHPVVGSRCCPVLAPCGMTPAHPVTGHEAPSRTGGAGGSCPAPHLLCNGERAGVCSLAQHSQLLCMGESPNGLK